MKKEEVFSKLYSKDYNNELEKVLEIKDFSIDVKNLLLSMLYKIEISYNDYATIKINVENKAQYLERIVDMVRKCSNITIIVPESEEQYKLAAQKKIKFVIDDLSKKIVTYPNEKIMLYALNELDNIVIYLGEKYNLIRVAFSQLLNEGRNINNVEVIRDFNAWSWNIQADEISNIFYNLIYQNLQILLGYEKFNSWLAPDEKDYIVALEKMLRQMYRPRDCDRLLSLLYKLAILICIEKNPKEKERLLGEKKAITNEIRKLGNVDKLIENVSENKKIIVKRISTIDKILSDKKLLEKEYLRRNSSVSTKSAKIFSLKHLIDVLNLERRKLVKKVEEYNKLLEPSNFMEMKEKFLQNMDLLKGIDFENLQKNNIDNYLLEFEKVFLNCFNTKIDKATTKKQVMDLVSIYRYYSFIPYNLNHKIVQIMELQENLELTKKLLIQKLKSAKLINLFTTSERLIEFILTKILNSKIAKLENIVIEFKLNNGQLNLLIYDKDTLEETYLLEEKNLKVKLAKKIKLFN